jgi:hypothetical protein
VALNTIKPNDIEMIKMPICTLVPVRILILMQQKRPGSIGKIR